MASSCVKPKRLCLVALGAVLWVWAAPGSGFVQGGRGAPKGILGVGAQGMVGVGRFWLVLKAETGEKESCLLTDSQVKFRKAFSCTRLTADGPQ